ncbi:MAG TPA: peptidylprolyl isomerase [Spirochaetes bacterium]|nr:peptidylprolyl isomerase [Spirochaetota bacterium]
MKTRNTLWLSIKTSLLVLVTLVFISQCQSDKKSNSPKDSTNRILQKVSKESSGMTAIIKTNKGTIKVELATKEAPKTSANFISLAKRGFYDGLTFHRVVANFVIQGGDPKGDGTGGAKKEIPLEILCDDGRMILGKTAPKDCKPVLQHLKGAIAMARSQDPNSASSQFYITLKDVNFLDRNYAVFGYVAEGQNVVDKIRVGDTMKSITLTKAK